MTLMLEDFLRIFKHICYSEGKMIEVYEKLQEDKRKEYIEIDSLDLEQIIEELLK